MAVVPRNGLSGSDPTSGFGFKVRRNGSRDAEEEDCQEQK